jgi:hypothetical protein
VDRRVEPLMAAARATSAAATPWPPLALLVADGFKNSMAAARPRCGRELQGRRRPDAAENSMAGTRAACPRSGQTEGGEVRC